MTGHNLSWPANAGHPVGFCLNSKVPENPRTGTQICGVTWVARTRAGHDNLGWADR